MLVWYFVASGVRENATGFLFILSLSKQLMLLCVAYLIIKKNTPTYPYGQAGAINDFINKS